MAEIRAKTRGQALLCGTPGTLRELAERSGISESVLSRLRSGQVDATERVAAVLEEKLGIPRDAWREYLNGEPGPEAVEAPTFGDASPRAHLVKCQKWHTDLVRKGAASKEITAALEAERRAVELVRKATEEDAEETINIILKALKAFPDAAEAVARALES